MEIRDMHKELVFFNAVLLTVPLYIRWDQFVIVQVTLTTPYNKVEYHFMLVFKRLHLNLLNIVTLLTHKVVLRDHPSRTKTIYNIFKSKCSMSTLKEIVILLSQLYVPYQKRISLSLFIRDLVVYLLPV